MSKSIFVSCVFEDSHLINTIKEWAKQGRLGEVAITHETEDKRHEGKDAIKEHLKNKIRGCAVILILLGNDTHNHPWIEAEVELANSFHKDIICVGIPNSNRSKPPILNKYLEIAFDPIVIKKEIDKLT